MRASITRSVDVTVREFHQGALIVAPAGTPDGTGTDNSPLDITTAVEHVLPGQSVELTEGTYQPAKTIRITPAYSGAAEAPKTLTARDGAKVIIDGRPALPEVMRVEADHWVISDLELTRAAGNGLRSSGSPIVFDSMVFSFNANTGFQLSGSGPRENWPADNLIINSEAHDNNLDGFSDNFNPGRLSVTNNTAVDNRRYNFVFRTNPYFEPEGTRGLPQQPLNLHRQPRSCRPGLRQRR